MDVCPVLHWTHSPWFEAWQRVPDHYSTHPTPWSQIYCSLCTVSTPLSILTRLPQSVSMNSFQNMIVSFPCIACGARCYWAMARINFLGMSFDCMWKEVMACGTKCVSMLACRFSRCILYIQAKALYQLKRESSESFHSTSGWLGEIIIR